MRLYLVRHGIAEEHNAAGDAQRALTPKGRVRMTEQAKGLRDIKVHPEIILSSPMRRALETAAIIAEGLGGVRMEQLPELGQGSAGPAEILSALRNYEQLREVALVGHQPGLGELASFMLTGSTTECQIEFKKGAVVCLERTNVPAADRYALIWSLPPRVLRSL